MKKKFFNCLLSATALGLLITGCSGSGKKDTSTVSSEQTIENTSDSKDVNLKIWTGKEDKEYIKIVTDKFIDKYKSEANITIEWSPMVEGNCRSNLLGDVLNGPDVYTTNDGDLQTIVAGGAASPVLNPDEIAANNVKVSVDAMTVNGKIYGYPITADNGYFLYYNKNYLSDEDIKSLDKILEVAAGKNKKFCMDWSSGWYLYSFFGQTGLKLSLNEDGVTNFCDWNSKTNDIKGTDVMDSLLTIAKNPGFECTGDFVKKVKEGTCIACVSGVWDESAMKEAMGDGYAASKLPTYTVNGKQVQMSCFFGYKMIGVNPYSSNIEWAHKLADFISNEENQTLRFEIRGQGPSNINAGKSDSILKSPAIQAVLAQSEFSELQRVGGNYWTAATELGLKLASGDLGKEDPQNYIDKIVKRITASNVQ